MHDKDKLEGMALVDELEQRVRAQKQIAELDEQQQQQEPDAAESSGVRGTRSCRRKSTGQQQQTRRRNPVRSAARKESEKRRRRQQQQQRGRGGARAPSRGATEQPSEPASAEEQVGADYEAPTRRDEAQWRQWPAHGMHERPVYHPQLGLAAEYNGRLFASYDGQAYRQVLDLEVARSQPRLPTIEQTPRPLPRQSIPLYDVQPFKHNANGRLFFVAAPALKRLQRPPAETTAPAQVLDLSNKQRRPAATAAAGSALSLVRYFQSFGADGSIDEATTSRHHSPAAAQVEVQKPRSSHSSGTT